MRKKIPALFFLILVLGYLLYTINRDLFTYQKNLPVGFSFENQAEADREKIFTTEIPLKQGDYTVTLRGQSDSDRNFIQILSDGEPLHIAPFLAGETSVTIPFRVEKPSEKIQIGGAIGPDSALFSIQNLTIHSDHVLYKESILYHSTLSLLTLLCFSLLIFCLLFPRKRDELIKKHLPSEAVHGLLFVLILTIFISYPIFTPDIVNGQDTTFHLSRIEGIKTNLQRGIFPARIHLFTVFDYGYGSGLFYPDFFLYFPAILRLLGFDLNLVFKILVFAINLFSISSIYLAAKNMFSSRFAGMAAAILFSCAASRIISIYNRSSIGEALATIFIPLIIWGWYELFTGKPERWPLLAIGFSGVTLSHMITLAMVGTISVIILLLNIRKILTDARIRTGIAKAVGITLGICAFFLFPFFEQLASQNILLNNPIGSPVNRGLPLSTVFVGFLPWQPPINPSVGYPLLLAPVFLLIGIKKGKLNPVIRHWLIPIGVIAIFLTTDLFPWKLFPNVNEYIQFPWRLLTIAATLLAISGGGILDAFISKASQRIALLFLFLFCSLYTVPAFQKIAEDNHIDATFYQLAQNQIGRGEYLPKKATVDFIDKNKNRVLSSDPAFVNQHFDREGLQFTVQFSVEQPVVEFELPLMYYKGYQAALITGDDERSKRQTLPVYSGAHGLTAVTIQDIQEGTLTVFYNGTIIQKISDLITLFTILALIFSAWFKRKRSLPNRMVKA